MNSRAHIDHLMSHSLSKLFHDFIEPKFMAFFKLFNFSLVSVISLGIDFCDYFFQNFFDRKKKKFLVYQTIQKF